MKIIGDGWAEYFKKCVPDDAGPEQISETKRAFYAGALTLFAGLSEAAQKEEIDGIAIHRSIRREFSEYVIESLGGVVPPPTDVVLGKRAKA